MSISISDELQLFAQDIQRFLSPNALQDLARNVGFVQKLSKYQAKDLIALCVDESKGCYDVLNSTIVNLMHSMYL